MCYPISLNSYASPAALFSLSEGESVLDRIQSIAKAAVWIWVDPLGESSRDITLIWKNSEVREQALVALFIYGLIFQGALSAVGIAFAVESVALHFLVDAAVHYFKDSFKEGLHLSLREKFFPLSACIKSIAVGITAVPFIKGGELLIESGFHWLSFLCGRDLFQGTQSFVSVAEGLDGLALAVLGCYMAVLAPIAEEYFFRGVLQGLFLHQAYKEKKVQLEQERVAILKDEGALSRLTQPARRAMQSCKQRLTGESKPSFETLQDIRSSGILQFKDRLACVLKASLIFALCHLSLREGLFNLAIITFFGITMGLLVEYTQNLWASSALHILNNALAFIQIAR